MVLGDSIRTKGHLQSPMLNGHWLGQHHITISGSKGLTNGVGFISLLTKDPSPLNIARRRSDHVPPLSIMRLISSFLKQATLVQSDFGDLRAILF